MNHFMSHCVLEMSLVFHLICAKQDPKVRVKASSFPIRTPATVDIVAREITSELSNVVTQITDYRA